MELPCEPNRAFVEPRWSNAVSILTQFILLLTLVGCSPNPDTRPHLSELAGTWIPTTHQARPPTQFLILTTNLTFIASNFPVSPNMGQTALVSGKGRWELTSSYAAFLVKFKVQGQEYPFRVVGRRHPFMLATSIEDDDETLQARRLEDTKR